jgi:prophage antirepressor-like protein
VLVDVCKAVGIGNVPNVASRLKGDEKASITIGDRRGIPHDTTIVNRPGLTKVLRYSTKPDAISYPELNVGASHIYRRVQAIRPSRL